MMTLTRVQVLHQGWLLTPANLESFLSTIISGIQKLEEHVSRIAACVIDELGEFSDTFLCYDWQKALIKHYSRDNQAAVRADDGRPV